MHATALSGRVSAPLKWHGGKWYLAPRIVALMPPHTHYVEPFAGGLAVMLAKDPEGVSEVANDLNGQLTNFWHVLQDRELFERFQRRIQATPFSQEEYEWAKDCGDDGTDVEIEVGSRALGAVIFFIRCRQSLAGSPMH